MKKSIVTSIVLLLGLTAFAEPELKGTASELAQFISTVPKTVVVTGEAEVRVPARRAVLSLQVATENKSLQEAMRANVELRTKLADYLKNQGIPAERIESAKFSSTPKFGMFSEKAKSYRVENEVRVSVQDEKEFQATAGAVDKWAEVQFGNVDFEYADKEQEKQNAIAKACDNASDQKKIYEEKLGLKLVPAGFQEGEIQQRLSALSNGIASKSAGFTGSFAISDGATESVSSFGEIIYTARVSVEYTVQSK